MAQWFGAVSVLIEDLGSIPASIWKLLTVSISSLRGSDTF